MTSAQLMILSAHLASAAAAPVPSPCVSICHMNEATGLCEGCFRTIDEIMAWGALAENAKRGVWARIEQRAQEAIAASAEVPEGAPGTKSDNA